MPETAITALFVYGTLKRDGVRGGLWPFSPVIVSEATTAAALYDLGPYPAIYAGNDIVAGELWQFQAWQMPETLAVLDRVEGFNQGVPDLYIRDEVACQLATGEWKTAYSYFYARNPDDDGNRVRPDADGKCRWPTDQKQ